MEYADAKLLTVLLLALPISALLAAWLAGRYRRRMVQLMRDLPAPSDTAAPGPPVSAPGRLDAAPFNLADNTRRNRRLAAVLVALCLLIGLSESAFYLGVVDPQTGFGLQRWLVLGAVHAWPMTILPALLWRWPLRRTVAAVLLYLVALVALVMWASTAQQSLVGVVGWLGGTVALPLLALSCLAVSGRIRAIAPLLFAPVALLLSASILGLDLAAYWSAAPPDTLLALVDAIGALPTVLVFALVPWLLAAGPAVLLMRLLATRYRAKAFSELSFLAGSYWLVVLTSQALPATHSVGALAFALLGATLWVPAGFALAARWLRPTLPPPTLLVLRVFQRDAQVQSLFDRVVDRWRVSGNTVLIAGTDLVSHTLDADDLFTHLSGRLAERFIATPEAVAPRLDAFDLAPDHDGRYRVNECYCTDASWQAALRALVGRADHVLMDLRGFAAHNAGCRFELGVLGRAAHLRRIVILHDEHTDQATANLELGDTLARVRWIDLGGGRRPGRAILQALAD
jgi:MFS family permease